MAPPKQDLPCNKEGKTDLDVRQAKRIINLADVHVYDT